MEMYLVHFRQKHGISYNAAVAAAASASPVDSNGIAVIAFKIEVSFSGSRLILSFAIVQIGAENKELLALTDAIGSSPTASLVAGKAPATTSGKLNMANLVQFANGGLDEYYYYNGSLTFPADMPANSAKHGCAEIVTWILPTKKLTVSQAQFDVFNLNSRLGFTSAEPDNNRKIQNAGTSTGVGTISGIVSAIFGIFGLRSSSSSRNHIYFRANQGQSAVAVNVARSILSTVTGIAVNELMRNPPDLESELIKIGLIRNMTHIEIPRASRFGHASTSIFGYPFPKSCRGSHKCACNQQCPGQFK